MACPTCQTPTREAQRFCSHCGLELLAWDSATDALEPVSCSVCTRQNPPIAEFCITCGSKLRAGNRSGRAVTLSTTEERRTVTLLHADLCGFTRMTERLDPEHTRNLLQALFHALSREVLERGGKVIAFIGDALLAVFGAPVAYGDDPRRAAEAALAIHQALGRFSHPVLERTESRLQMRIGLETGPVVIGRSGVRGQLTVTGPTLAAAMELERSATPGLTLIGDATMRFLAEDYVLTQRPYSKGDAYELLGRKASLPGTGLESTASLPLPAGMAPPSASPSPALSAQAAKGEGDEIFQARLDALPVAERRLLRLASISGGRFWLELLERLGVHQPQPLLERLVQEGELSASAHTSIHGTTEYSFVSGRLCVVAYETNLLKVRRFNHCVTAAWLEERLEEQLELFPLLLWHYQQGEDLGGMARALVQAGQRLMSRRARREARERLEEAVQLLAPLPERAPELQGWLDRATEALRELSSQDDARKDAHP